MVFAPNEAKFYELMETMQKEARILGYDTVYEEDLKNAKEQDAARKQAVSLSGN
jgi:multiple sugar transport system substrate-binding protein/putative aldouronate transport system substrate-binding protein